MKRFILASVSAVTLLVAIAPSVFAQTSVSAAFTIVQSACSIPDITPTIWFRKHTRDSLQLREFLARERSLAIINLGT